MPRQRAGLVPVLAHVETHEAARPLVHRAVAPHPDEMFRGVQIPELAPDAHAVFFL